MAFDLSSITTETTTRPPRVVLLGSEKSGKSTFASEAPGVVFLPIKGEEGIDSIEVASFPVAETFADVKEAIKTLITSDHNFKNLAIDSTSALEPLIWAEICRLHGAESIESVGGGYGKGYLEAVNIWADLLNGLDVLRNKKGMGVFMIGHVTTTTFNDPEHESYTQYSWDVHKKASATVNRWADSILFIGSKVYTKSTEAGFNKTEVKATGSDTRYLFTTKSPTRPGGGRGVYGQLPAEIPLNLGSSYQTWVDAIVSAKSTTTTKEA